MKIRANGAAIVFLLIAACSFFSYTQNALAFESNILPILKFPIVLGFFGGMIFLIGTWYSDRKIEQQKFAWWKILLFNILLWFVSLPIGMTIASVLIGRGPEPLVDIFIIGYIVPMVLAGMVLGFSFIPSLILPGLHENEKAQRIISLVALGISVLILILSVLMFYSCNLGMEAHCLQKQASEKNDPLVCNRGATDNAVDMCYYLVFNVFDMKEGIQYAPNQEFCQSIKQYPEGYGACITKLSRLSGNTTSCEGIVDNYMHESCLLQNFKYDNVETCRKLREDERKFICLREIARNTNNSAACDEILAEMNKSDFIQQGTYFECIERLAQATQNKSICDRINQFPGEIVVDKDMYLMLCNSSVRSE